MAQHDYVIANGTGAAVRSDINNGLAAIVSNNSGATEPATMYAYQWWADTTTGLLKLRNAANNAWITLFQLDGEWSTLAVENGSAAAPSIYFKDSGTDTGIYSPGTDQVAISTGGTGRLFVDSSGRVGLGTSSPSSNLTVSGSTTLLRIIGSGSSTDFRIDNSVSDFIVQTGSGGSGGSNGLHFYNVNTSAYRLSLTNDGKLGIGTTSPGAPLHVNGGDIILQTADPGTRLIRPTFAGGALQLAGSSATSDRGLRFGFVNNALSFSEFGRFDESGRLLVGTSSGQGNSLLQIQGDASSTAAAGALYLRRGLNTAAIGANVGADLGSIQFGANDGTVAASIQSLSDATWSSTSDTPGRLVFSTTADGASSPTERMRISHYGRFDMRTDTAAFGGSGIPTLGLWSSGTTASTQYLIYGAHSSGSAYSGTNCFQVINNGNVLNTNNSYGSLSDIKLKENIVDAGSQWDDLKGLQVRKYNFKAETNQQTHTQIGLIAQEVELVSPGLVSESPDRDEDGNDLGTVTKSVNYSVLYMKAVKALQEAMERIEVLEQRLADAGIA